MLDARAHNIKQVYADSRIPVGNGADRQQFSLVTFSFYLSLLIKPKVMSAGTNHRPSVRIIVQEGLEHVKRRSWSPLRNHVSRPLEQDSRIMKPCK